MATRYTRDELVARIENLQWAIEVLNSSESESNYAQLTLEDEMMRLKSYLEVMDASVANMDKIWVH